MLAYSKTNDATWCDKEKTYVTQDVFPFLVTNPHWINAMNKTNTLYLFVKEPWENFKATLFQDSSSHKPAKTGSAAHTD